MADYPLAPKIPEMAETCHLRDFPEMAETPHHLDFMGGRFRFDLVDLRHF